MRASVFVGTSLDGFIAREDGGIDWLMQDTTTPEEYGYSAFFASVDVVVMGRNTFELVRGFSPWPYGTKPVVVLTTRPLELPAELASVSVMSGTPAEVVTRLAERGYEHLYVDGGRTVQAFLSAGLISRIIIAQLPVLIGRGIPLFGPVPRDIALRHVWTRTFASGMVQSEYQVCDTGSHSSP